MDLAREFSKIYHCIKSFDLYVFMMSCCSFALSLLFDEVLLLKEFALSRYCFSFGMCQSILLLFSVCFLISETLFDFGSLEAAFYLLIDRYSYFYFVN